MAYGLQGLNQQLVGYQNWDLATALHNFWVILGEYLVS